ncbi:MAG TPA: hypothetical protein PL182_05400 [Pseudobdellovibrionaceae bacterium]|nr:hypothetical protein [Pseudobdellovibrionaceae bacterium]
MRSFLFAFLMTTIAVPALADFVPQFEALRRAADEQCRIPEKLHPISEKHYQRFLAQILLPELKMLNTAFVSGFSTHMSKYQPLANCVVVFLGRPNDPFWEKNFSFYNRARAADSVPEMMFQGFDENGAVILVPTPEGGVN